MAKFVKQICSVSLFLIFLIDKTIGNRTIGDILQKEDYLNLNCYGQSMDDVYFQPFSNIRKMREVNFIDCCTFEISFATVLQQINVILTESKRVILTYEKKSVTFVLTSAHFKDLGVKELSITNTPGFPHIQQMLSADTFSSLLDLWYLDLTAVDAPPLPVFSLLRGITLKQSKSLGAFGGCSELQELELHSWDLKHIPERWLENCSRLTTIKLTSIDNLMSSNLRKIVEGPSALQSLSIDKCHVKEFPIIIISRYARNLKKLLLFRGGLNKLSLSQINMKSLVSLDIFENTPVELEGIPHLRTASFVLNLYNTEVNVWRFENSDYKMIKVHARTRLVVNANNMRLNCDCQNGWLARTITEHQLLMSVYHTQCTNKGGAELGSLSRDAVECDRFNCSGCTCRRQWSDNSTVAHCSGTVTRIPRVEGLRALHAAGNRIEVISIDDLPDMLLFLDLTSNRISTMDGNVTSKLFSVKERRIRLANNPLGCPCGNRLFIEILQTYKEQVEDYQKLWCIDGDRRRLVRDVVPSELCAAEVQLQRQVGLYIALSVCAVLLALAAVSGVFYCRYKQHLKVYLYAHGYCMWCLHEDEVDSDRLYDAFVSFSHRDEDFVIDEILPRLDTEYKLCLHFRDWVVGDFIPAQITRSVEQSRRTIIILSRNFVESVWGLLEFRTAHTSALNEGRARIIIIVLDDVLESKQLAPELRSYVRTNTYVQWGDKWFWDKLRYAMSHGRSASAVAEVPSDVFATDDDGARPPAMEMRRCHAPMSHDSAPIINSQ